MDETNPYAPPRGELNSASGPSMMRRNPVVGLIAAMFRWLIAPQRHPTVWGTIAWWEVRRVPVNFLIGGYGAVCLVVFVCAIVTNRALQPGEDAIEPLAVIVVPFAFNVSYTLGWLVEVPARIANPRLSPRFGPALIKLGLGFSFCVLTLPPALWLCYRCFVLIGGRS